MAACAEHVLQTRKEYRCVSFRSTLPCQAIATRLWLVVWAKFWCQKCTPMPNDHNTRPIVTHKEEIPSNMQWWITIHSPVRSLFVLFLGLFLKVQILVFRYSWLFLAPLGFYQFFVVCLGLSFSAIVWSHARHAFTHVYAHSGVHTECVDTMSELVLLILQCLNRTRAGHPKIFYSPTWSFQGVQLIQATCAAIARPKFNF